MKPDRDKHVSTGYNNEIILIWTKMDNKHKIQIRKTQKKPSEQTNPQLCKIKPESDHKNDKSEYDFRWRIRSVQTQSQFQGGLETTSLDGCLPDVGFFKQDLRAGNEMVDKASCLAWLTLSIKSSTRSNRSRRSKWTFLLALDSGAEFRWIPGGSGNFPLPLEESIGPAGGDWGGGGLEKYASWFFSATFHSNLRLTLCCSRTWCRGLDGHELTECP